MDTMKLLPNRAITPGHEEYYVTRGLARILGAKTIIAIIPGLEWLAQTLTPKLTIPQIRKRLEKAGLSSPEGSLKDAREIIEQGYHDSGRWPVYEIDEFKNPRTGHSSYRFTPCSYADDSEFSG